MLSVYVGLRPLVKGDGKTSALSRDHVIHVDPSGLLTITGGKWTTYRHMAEDCVDHAITLGRLRDEPCRTRNLHIHGYLQPAAAKDDSRPQSSVESREPLDVYGTDREEISSLAEADTSLAVQLDPALPYTGAEIVWAARCEMARTVEDALARRTRALFLNSGAAIAMAPAVAKLLAAELGRDQAWIDAELASFSQLASQYQVLQRES